MANDDGDRIDLAIPTGRWIRLAIPECTDFVGYTYVDPDVGLAAKGQVGEKLVKVPLPAGPSQLLDPLEVNQLGLPEVPDWLREVGPQPTIGTSFGAWQIHPVLRGRFHPHNRDDVQVLVHEGGPRLSEHKPELLWVRINTVVGKIYGGTIVDKPAKLTKLKQGDTIQFVAPEGGPQPMLVTRQYLEEKPNWKILPCQTCGLAELFDAPSDLVRVVFPDLPAGAKSGKFTAKCGACGGIQGVEPLEDDDAPKTMPPRSKWNIFKK